jgi:lipopolysaccharide/colanic/teichoic acid biosynthesis glycosyltransferase
MIILSPILVATAIAIKIDSSGPILFRQKRVGLNGRNFTLYKFRSMVKNAEKMREQIEHLNEMSGPVFKIRDDPRLTKVGKFIRKFSIDELPQLFNVLKGDMSLVGIRPPISEEVKKYERWQRRRLSMKPGITCIWQVSGRNKVDFDQWMRMDLNYIDNWSLKLDFKLLLKTIPAVLFTKGAM